MSAELCNTEMKKELESMLNTVTPDQWNEVDFTSIRKAIYNLFKEMGWMI